MSIHYLLDGYNVIHQMPSALNPMPTTQPGFMTRREAIDRYLSRSGRDTEDVDWYVVFGTFKLAVILQQIYIRWHRGQTRDERFAPYGEGAARLIQLADERRRH
jgi:aminoglycoside phosphotransferase (APT) family kinase protein